MQRLEKSVQYVMELDLLVICRDLAMLKVNSGVKIILNTVSLLCSFAANIMMNFANMHRLGWKSEIFPWNNVKFLVM